MPCAWSTVERTVKIRGEGHLSRVGGHAHVEVPLLLELPPGIMTEPAEVIGHFVQLLDESTDSARFVDSMQPSRAKAVLTVWRASDVMTAAQFGPRD